MKKLFLLLIMFLFIGQANAKTIEDQLVELKNNVNDLETKMNDTEKNRLNKIYPIGSIYETTTYSTANEVGEALGGVWERYGNGKTLVGVDENDTDFNRAGINDKGSKTTTLSIKNLPSHTHSIPALSGTAVQGSTAATGGNHTHSIPAVTVTTSTAGSHYHESWTTLNANEALSHGMSGLSSSGYAWIASGGKGKKIWMTESAGSHSHTVTIGASTSGGGGAHSHSVTTVASTSGGSGSDTAFTNMQPYITVYMYKRVS